MGLITLPREHARAGPDALERVARPCSLQKSMPSQSQSVRMLAAAIAAGPMDDWQAMRARAKPLVGDLRKARWLTSLVRKLSDEFGNGPRPPERQIADRVRDYAPFVRAWTAGRGRVTPAPVEPVMAPASGAPRNWTIPAITTPGDLAMTLRIHSDDLGWLTAHGQTEHYLHRWRTKAKSGRYRLIEIPKPLLKLAQRRVLRAILDAIPPHEAAQGFRRGSSVRDFVEPHAGRPMLIRMDLEDFFPSIGFAKVMRLFLTAGYPEAVAHALTRLVTHPAPFSVLAERPLAWAERRRLAVSHLPQGAPTSPALANLCAFRLDCRLMGLARAAGADYTRYADDLLFSGGEEFARQARRFQIAVSAIVMEEGFRPNHRKTRFLRPGQRQTAAGIVLNQKPNVSRREFDRLKAILTNCVRSGPQGQNRADHADFRGHLAGKIAWIRFIAPERAAKLNALFEQIDWSREE